uniref:C-type lectin domain-containing protein n=1 Tax=Calidris pygmaea TaxID=425635 RepID=A0A8C3KM56_9CHAR
STPAPVPNPYHPAPALQPMSLSPRSCPPAPIPSSCPPAPVPSSCLKQWAHRCLLLSLTPCQVPGAPARARQQHGARRRSPSGPSSWHSDLTASHSPGQWLQGLSLGWRYHQGKIYYLSGEEKPWSDAEAACRFTHSHLASITSSEEQEYLAREARGGSYWIGLTAMGPRGSWHWVDGTAYNQAQSFWAPGQPDNTDHGQWGQESCAQIHPVRNGLWNDHNCNFSFPWICKRDLSMP